MKAFLLALTGVEVALIVGLPIGLAYFIGYVIGRAKEFRHTAELLDSLASFKLKPEARDELLRRLGVREAR